MNCREFKDAYRDMVGTWIAADDPARDPWNEHMHNCEACGDWYQERQVRDRGADPGRYPCVHMAYRVTYQCPEHDDPWECPDYLLVYNEQFDEYGIPVRDGGPSMVTIDYCPWCGVKLPGSKRDLWFEELEAMGFDDPWEQDIPEEFKSDRWWRSK